MLITLDELNKCVKGLPNPVTALDQHRNHWRVPIAPDIPVQPLSTEMPINVDIRIATFELKKVIDHGRRYWRWAPCDEVVI